MSNDLIEEGQPPVEEFADVVNQMLIDDTPRDDLITKIDDALDVVFEPDPKVKQLPWVKGRHYAMTDIADARDTGVRTFDTLMPQINVQPLNDETMEYERTEMAEQALEWEFQRMNRVGKKGVYSQILEDAMSYHAVAIQTEYLPYKYKDRKKDNRTKAILRQRALNWIRHHPKTVHARWSDETLEVVAKVANYSAQSLIEKYGKENPGIVQMMEDRGKDNKPIDLLRSQYTLIDLQNWDDRVIWAVPAGTLEIGKTSVPVASLTAASSSQYVFMNKKHGMPFLNWVIVDKGNPIWAAVLKSGMWDNLQYMNLIRFAKSIELSTRSTLVIRTPDGKLHNVWIDFSNPSNPIVIPMDGTEVKDLAPAPLDPALETMFQEASAKVASSTVSHVLRDVTKFSNAPFATVNQMIQLALGQLSRAKNAGGETVSMGLTQFFEWVEFSGMAYNAYRPSGRDSRANVGSYHGRGEQITIRPGAAPTQTEVESMNEQEMKLLKRTVYFDLEALYIDVQLQSNNTADEQSRLNVNINAVDKLGMSKQMAWERMGWKNYNLANRQRLDELMEESELQNEIYKNSQQAQDEMKQQLMEQMQKEAQEQAKEQAKSQGSQMTEMNGGSQPLSQGSDMRTGAPPAAMGNPTGTREALTGQSASGQEIPQ
jgi:hypothetical protein